MNKKRNVGVDAHINQKKHEGADFISAQNGITLVALVITIIILLILAAITLGFVFGKNGIIKMAQNAGKNYANAENEESNTLNDLYSSMLIATNDDAKITVSVEELRNLIKQEVSKELQGSIKLENASLKSLTSVVNSSTNIGVYDMGKFTRNEETIAAEYLEYKQEKNVYIVKKSGWYVIRMESHSEAISEKYSNNHVYVKVGESEISVVTCGLNSTVDYNTDSTTLYIVEGTELSVRNQISGTSAAKYANASMHIYALGD